MRAEVIDAAERCACDDTDDEEHDRRDQAGPPQASSQRARSWKLLRQNRLAMSTSASVVIP